MPTGYTDPEDEGLHEPVYRNRRARLYPIAGRHSKLLRQVSVAAANRDYSRRHDFVPILQVVRRNVLESEFFFQGRP